MCQQYLADKFASMSQSYGIPFSLEPEKKNQVLSFSVHALWCHQDLSISPLAVVKMVIYLFGEKRGLCEIRGILAIYLLRFPCNIFCFLYRTVLLLGFCAESIPSGCFFDLVFKFLFLSILAEFIWILTFGYFSSLLEETKRLNMLYLHFWNVKWAILEMLGKM